MAREGANRSTSCPREGVFCFSCPLEGVECFPFQAAAREAGEAVLNVTIGDDSESTTNGRNG